MLFKHVQRRIYFCCSLLLLLPFFSQGQQQTAVFTNPLLPSGPDPWVIQQDTNYFYTNTFGSHIALYKTSRMSGLGKVTPVTIWVPPASGPYSKDIWAPEIHYINNAWYVYFAADDGHNENHRIYVLENRAANPLEGRWVFKGKLADTAADKWAIDASVFSYKSVLYCIWSGWEGDTNGRQSIYIARMKNPAELEGHRVLISTPTYAWEKQGAPPVVNEGPEALVSPAGRLLITFSASGCWTDDYELGLLTLRPGGNPLNAADWVKSPVPVFETAAANGAYAPGHNGFFISRNGKESWIIYHANAAAGQGCGGRRSPRMQKFTWNKDGTPNFGAPAAINTPIQKPGGE
ncbi:MAG TPA: glycoside hydrolase family 43 protein [Chitinophagaceae bacterium]|nr:glycoside hydrolase family 43 protein [Chitinophagaceae bacterium]